MNHDLAVKLLVSIIEEHDRQARYYSTRNFGMAEWHRLKAEEARKELARLGMTEQENANESR